jgi:hypothetical protein
MGRMSHSRFPEGRTKQREQRLILVGRQERSILDRPPLLGGVEAHDPYLAQKRFRHLDPPLYEGGGPPGEPATAVCSAHGREQYIRLSNVLLTLAAGVPAASASRVPLMTSGSLVPMHKLASLLGQLILFTARAMPLVRRVAVATTASRRMVRLTLNTPLCQRTKSDPRLLI